MKHFFKNFLEIFCFFIDLFHVKQKICFFRQKSRKQDQNPFFKEKIGK